MDRLKAAFGEVMKPQQNRQLEDDALVKTMKVHSKLLCTSVCV